jgi:hypothetical protein
VNPDTRLTNLTPRESLMPSYPHTTMLPSVRIYLTCVTSCSISPQSAARSKDAFAFCLELPFSLMGVGYALAEQSDLFAEKTPSSVSRAVAASANASIL